MTVSTTTDRVQYATNGTTGPWTVPFRFLQDSHLQVVHADSAGVETVLVLNTGYTVTGAGGATGTVTTTTAYPAVGTITIVRNVPLTQETDYGENDPFPANTHEMRLDWLTMAAQQLAEKISRSFILPVSSALSSLTFPGPGAGKYVRWNVLGTALEVVDAVADLGNFIASYVGSVSRTAISKMGDHVNVADFGFSGSASAAVNTAALQTAIDRLGAAGGRNLYLPPGNFTLSGVITVDHENMRIIGEGSGMQHITLDGCTILTADHTAGPVFRFKKGGFRLEGVTLDASATRQAAAASTTNHGIWVEAEDAANLSMKRFRMHDVRVTNQPASAFVFIGDVLSSEVHMCDADQSGGHAFVINGGGYTGRTNLQRPGQIELINCRGTRSGGHSLAIGDAGNDPNERPYRVRVSNFESFYNCQDAAVKLADSDWYIFGENIEVYTSACNGETSAGVGAHGGMTIAGQNIFIKNHRFVDCDVFCATIEDRAGGFTTNQIEFDGAYINNTNAGPGHYNPAFVIASACRNVKVSVHSQSSDISTLTSSGSLYLETNFQDTQRFAGQHVANSYKSCPSSASLADDQAGYWSDDGVMQGMALIVGNADGAGHALIAFRTGDGSAFCRIIAHSGTVDAGSGVIFAAAANGTLADGDGTDGRVTLCANTTLNRLYISNRSGGSRSYSIAMFGPNANGPQSFTEV